MPDGRYVENLDARKAALDYAFQLMPISSEKAIKDAEAFYLFLIDT